MASSLMNKAHYIYSYQYHKVAMIVLNSMVDNEFMASKSGSKNQPYNSICSKHYLAITLLA